MARKDRPQKKCTAHKKDGSPCGRWAREGYPVCPMHGAGTAKRVKEGKRKDPGTAALKTGLYASKAHEQLKETIGGYLKRKADLWNLNAVAARLWAALERADRIEYAIDISELEGAEGEERVDLAVDMLRRLQASVTILDKLGNLILGRERLLTSGSDTLTRGQVVAMFLQILNIVREVAGDTRISREDIAVRVAERLEALAVQLDGQQGPRAHAP